MRRKLIIAFTAMSMWGGALAEPIAAADPTECYEDVILWCSDAMDEASRLERFALGLLCTALLGGCVVEGAVSVAIS